MRAALRDPDTTAATAGLAAAADDFADAAALDEGRDDAVVYGAACRAVVAFAASDREQLAAAATTIADAAARRDAWHFNAHVPAWRRRRLNAEFEWAALAADLRIAADDLDTPAWLDATAAVGRVARVYAADRTVLPGAGLARIIRPQIENSIAASAALAYQLAAAVAADRAQSQPRLPAAADALAAAIHSRRGAAGTSTADDDAEDDPPGADARLDRCAPRLRLLPPAVRRDLAAALTDDALAELDPLLAASTAPPIGDHPALGAVRDQMLEVVAADSRIAGSARAAVAQLLDTTLAFLLDRYNRGSRDSRSDYLRLLGKREEPPHENELQADFYVWLASGPYAGRASCEQSGIATGRVDVVVRLDRVALVTEIKRELDHPPTRSALSGYVPQAAAYSGANVPFSQLLVLDLTPHLHGVPPLADLVWMAMHFARPGASGQHVATGVVVGNRPTPSELR
jgi:hypothetical protein